MYTGVDNNEAYQAIQEKVQTNKHNGYAVISPGATLATGSYAVTVDSGTLDAADTLSVGAANDEVLFNGGVQSLSGATSIQIDSVSESNGNEQYRYDTIWADSSGEVQITKGTVVEVANVESQNNLTRFERFKGTIPFPSTYPSVVIAVVVVSSDDASIGTENLRDYRIPADTTANEVDSQSVVTDDLRTKPDVSVISFSTNQSIPNDTITAVTFDKTLRDTAGAADLSNDQITIPSGYNEAQLTIHTAWVSNPTDQFISLEGSVTYPYSDIYRSAPEANNNPSWGPQTWPWMDVAAGETISFNIRQQSGGALDLLPRTFLGVWLV